MVYRVDLLRVVAIALFEPFVRAFGNRPRLATSTTIWLGKLALKCNKTSVALSQDVDLSGSRLPQDALRHEGFAVLIGIGYAAFEIRRVWPRYQALKLGRDGEKWVGQFLEQLREKGYQVFHDVVGAGFNVDHVLIGPAGAFTVETKTFSKRPSRDAKIIFDGERIVVDGHEPDRDPVIQAKA